MDYGKKISLGLTGNTIADISCFNPEAISLINKNPEIFEIILRPFSHDLALLRSPKGFFFNFDCGRKAIMKEFRNISPYFLPPEFMVTSGQLQILSDNNVKGVFINPVRFSEEHRMRIPCFPYQVKGLYGSQLCCLPVAGEFADAYLDSIHAFDSSPWNTSVLAHPGEYSFSWRDGESPFLIPNGLERESFWLKNEAKSIARKHLKEISIFTVKNEDLNEGFYRSYPVHSFASWMKESMVIGFIYRLQKFEGRSNAFSVEQKALWLQVINSDILSSIEKKSPVVKIKKDPSSKKKLDFTIRRTERGFEGEEYLSLLEISEETGKVPDYIYKSDDAHIQKLRSRLEYIKSLHE
jgi:hypothetical protein